MVTFDFFSFCVQGVEALGSSTMPGATGPLGHSYFGLDSPFQGYEIPSGQNRRGCGFAGRLTVVPPGFGFVQRPVYSQLLPVVQQLVIFIYI